jgi:hypothetical protein
MFLQECEISPKLKSSRTRSSQSNSGLTEATQFLKILQRHGLKHRYWLKVLQLAAAHRQVFEHNNIYFAERYPNYLGFYLYAQNNKIFLDLGYLLEYVAKLLNPCLQLKVVLLPKFLQKKYRKRYDFKIKHVPVASRQRYVYRRILIYSGFLTHRNLINRVYLSLAESFLNPDFSPLQKERLNFYRHALRLYKLGGLNFKAL